MLDMVGGAKWKSWSALGEMSSVSAVCILPYYPGILVAIQVPTGDPGILLEIQVPTGDPGTYKRSKYIQEIQVHTSDPSTYRRSRYPIRDPGPLSDPDTYKAIFDQSHHSLPILLVASFYLAIYPSKYCIVINPIKLYSWHINNIDACIHNFLHLHYLTIE